MAMNYVLNDDGMILKDGPVPILEANDIVDFASLDISEDSNGNRNYGYMITIEQAKEVLLRIVTDAEMQDKLDYARIRQIIINVMEGL